ncbi:hypothetical protein SRHO_G00144870 [Serrasalmus rhombeus]
MSAGGKEHDMVCQKAVALIADLCIQDSPLLDHNTCEEFLFLIANQDYSLNQPANCITITYHSSYDFNKEQISNQEN